MKTDPVCIAGRLYNAWCAAAVGLPVLAGALFDRSGSYASTVWVAARINVLGMVVAGRLPGRWCGPSATPRRARLNPLVDSATPGYRSASLMGCSSAFTRLTPPSA